MGVRHSSFSGVEERPQGSDSLDSTDIEGGGYPENFSYHGQVVLKLNSEQVT